MKKSIFIGSMVLVSAMILLCVYFVLFSTVTYSGVVVSSKSTDDHIEFIIQDEKTNEQITILADIHTDVQYCHLERDVYLGDLMNKTGSTVEICCKRYFNHNKYSESIVIQYSHESGMDDFK